MALVGDDIDPIEAPCENVEMRNDEYEEPSEAEVRRARTNPKTPAGREKQEHEESGHAVLQKLACCLCRRTGSWWTTQEEERERTLPIVAFEYCFMTQEHADTLPVLIGQTGATCCERKGSTAYSISFLVAFIKDPGFHRVNHSEMCLMNQARNHCKEAVIHACGEEDFFFHWDHLKVDHTANGRVHVAVREVERHCRTLRIF